jgi:Xaa-Pro aminopeptidase
MSLDGHEFQAHRLRVLDLFKSAGITTGVILYESPVQPVELLADSDEEFHQEALFFWLTGWDAPDSGILIDLATSESTLLIPTYDHDYQIWHGPVPSSESILTQTGVDRVAPLTSLPSLLASLNPPTVYSTSLPVAAGDFPVDRDSLLTASSIARTIKTAAEVVALRTAAQLTGEAIKAVWRGLRWHKSLCELDIASAFAYHGALLGCPQQAFVTVAAAGSHAAYLRYHQNAPVLEGDLILLDCGLFFCHYAGAITRTFPASGRFSEQQAKVYGALLRAQKTLCAAVRPGLMFCNMDDMMAKAVFEVLREIGVVGEAAQYSAEVAGFFVPHSLSHHIGANGHDVCMHLVPSRIPDPNATERAGTLAPGMVISIKPGVYFHRTRIPGISSSPHFEIVNESVALEYSRTVGGIRIEDDLLVTETGAEVLSANCPKEIAEIEAILGSGEPD